MDLLNEVGLALGFVRMTRLELALVLMLTQGLALVLMRSQYPRQN